MSFKDYVSKEQAHSFLSGLLSLLAGLATGPYKLLFAGFVKAGMAEGIANAAVDAMYNDDSHEMDEQARDDIISTINTKRAITRVKHQKGRRNK